MVGSYIDFGEKLGKSDLDITNRHQCDAVFSKLKPFLVIHLAALTDLSLCEKDPGYAYETNVLGTYNIVRACHDHNVKIIYLSSGAVFDGMKEIFTEDDLPRPLNIYGRTKYIGELIVQDIVPQHLIIRTGWLFGGGKTKDSRFISKIIAQIEAGQEIKVIKDRFGSPTYIKDVIDHLKKLIIDNASGIFHVVNSDGASYYEYAQEIRELFKSDINIKSISTDKFQENVPRAKSEVLISKKITPLRSWKKALAQYLKNEW